MHSALRNQCIAIETLGAFENITQDIIQVAGFRAQLSYGRYEKWNYFDA
jgi:hypothetical protein